jgi:hypothetical protein
VARFFALQTGPQRLMRALLAEAVELTGGSFGLVALSGAQAAAATLQQLHSITRLEQIDQAGPGPVLDLARSVQRAP